MMSLPNIEVSFRHFPDEAADGIHVSHITDDVLFCVCNIGGSNAYDVHVLLRDGLEPGGIMGVDLAPCEEVSYPLKRILGNKLKQVRRKIGFTSGSESLELIFDVSYRSDKGQHVTTSRFALDGSTGSILANDLFSMDFSHGLLALLCAFTTSLVLSSH